MKPFDPKKYLELYFGLLSVHLLKSHFNMSNWSFLAVLNKCHSIPSSKFQVSEGIDTVYLTFKYPFSAQRQLYLFLHFLQARLGNQQRILFPIIRIEKLQRQNLVAAHVANIPENLAHRCYTIAGIDSVFIFLLLPGNIPGKVIEMEHLHQMSTKHL